MLTAPKTNIYLNIFIEIMHNYYDTKVILKLRGLNHFCLERINAISKMALPLAEDIKLALAYIRNNDSNPDAKGTPKQSRYNTVHIYPLKNSKDNMLLQFRSKWIEDKGFGMQESTPRQWEICPKSKIIAFSNKQFKNNINVPQRLGREQYKFKVLNSPYQNLDYNGRREFIQCWISSFEDQIPTGYRLLSQTKEDLERLIESLKKYSNPKFQQLIPVVNTVIDFHIEHNEDQCFIRQSPKLMSL